MSDSTPVEARVIPRGPERGAALLQFVDAYLATIVSAGSLLVCLFFVPQTASIMAQTRLADDFSYAPEQTVLRGMLTLAFAASFLFLFAVVFPPDPKLEPPAPEARLWSFLHGLGACRA